MKALSFRQASACENATTSHCRCRCGGAFHGAKRVVDIANLPADDPHAGPRKRRRTKVLEHGSEPWRLTPDDEPHDRLLCDCLDCENWRAAEKSHEADERPDPDPRQLRFPGA